VKILLSTGKGGVGKTSVAAASAVRCAELGHRSVVISADPAHSLGDVFGIELGSEPVEIAPRLSGQQLDAHVRMADAWVEIREWLLEVLEWGGVDRVAAEELLLVPGMEEVFSLLEVLEFATSGEWDVVVVDCGPTAETVRLLSLPDVLEFYSQRVMPIGRRVNRVAAPVLGRLTTLPIADDGVWTAADRFLAQLAEVRALLTGPDSLVRLVLNPQKVVVAESRRAHAALSMFGYRVDAVVANRVLPDEVDDPWFDAWRRSQTEQLEQIETGFGRAQVLVSPFMPTEPIGIEDLSAFARQLFGERDPAEAMADIQPFEIVADGDHWRLLVHLGSVTSEEVDVSRRDDELLLVVAGVRRSLLLPASLASRSIVDAQLEGGTVEVTFGGTEP